eukprot:g2159.t1
MSVNFSQMKKKWEKRKQVRLKEETARRQVEAKRREEEAKQRAIEEANRPKARIPHYGGVISTNKDIAMRKFLLRKWGNESELSKTQKEALNRMKKSLKIKHVSQVKKEIKSVGRKRQFQKIMHAPTLIVNRDDAPKEQGGRSKGANVVSLSRVLSGTLTPKNNRPSGKNKKKKKTADTAGDDFLSTDLDSLAGISRSGKKSSLSKRKTNTLLKKSNKKKRKTSGGNVVRQQHQRKKKRQSGGNEDKFSFLSKGLDDI